MSSQRSASAKGLSFMSNHLESAKEYHAAIRDVLLKEWDPIGVSHVPEAQDEYDSYVSQIHGMLIRREPRHKLVDFLWWAETAHMGLYGNRRRTETVADSLLNLCQHLEGTD